MADIKMTRIEKTLLLVWFVLNLVIGALTVHEYGMSIDETNNQRYAVDTWKAYPSFFGTRYAINYDSSYDGHGPAFMSLALVFIRGAQMLFPALFEPDLWHFAYFMTFLLTGLCLYWLARRWFHPWTAWGVLILFGTQPLLRGHAFMNPKDIPFLFFLTLSVALGFHMVDSVKVEEPLVSVEKPAKFLTDRFQQSHPRRRRKFLILLTLGLAVAAALLVFSGQINSFMKEVVLFFYQAEPSSWAGCLFNSVASPAVPAEDYVSKAMRLFARAERGLFVLGVLFFLAYFGLLVYNTTLRAVLHNTWAQRHRLGNWTRSLAQSLRESLRTGSLKRWFAEMFRALRSSQVLLAGIALGLATGIRAIGPVAGVIVFLYLLAKVRSRAWATGIAYFLIAGIVTYLVWPRLWDAPIQRYLEALGVVSNFESFPGRVLFNGRLYGASELPHSYLPVLLNLQLTEPLLLSVYLGIGLLGWQLLRNRVRADLLVYIGLGFAFPFFGLIVLNSALYHNFRQALFLIPALMMIAAFALEWVFDKVNQTWMRALLLAVLALPGLYSMVRLYPYEYVYYNSLVGGTAGAAYRYELDYWRISLREMALEMNEIARPGSTIVVTRSAGLFARYARPDLIVDKPINSILDLDHGYDYLIEVARGKGDGLYPDIEDLVVVERAGVVLATAKDVKDVSGK